jgi:hypothetical protein
MSMHALTGPWLMVKWVGVSIAYAYLVLLLTVFIRFRRDLTRLRRWLIWPAVLGVFISSSVPYIFQDVTVTRVCFVAASVVYVGGIGILLTGLAQKNHQALLKADG